MIMENGFSEQGAGERLPSNEGLLAEFYTTDRRYFAGLGEITDIDKEGLSGLFMTDKTMTTTDVAEVAIVKYTSSGRVPLRAIPCRLISDVEVVKSPSGMLVRLCSVKFENELPLFGT